MDFSTLDPKWAWSVFEPDKKNRWDRQRITHLFRRAGFGAGGETLEKAAGSPPAEVVRELVEGREVDAEQDAEFDGLAKSVLAGANSEQLAAWWLYRMLYSPDQLGEKVTLFWHGHFATGADKVNDARLMHRQNQLLREHAMSDFKQLVQGISRDPAMLIYLDSATNRKAHPNENFAREVMELFCLGEGNYTEKDIRELARCFTGWEVRRGKFRFNRYQHDGGMKRFLGASGKFDGEDGVRVVLEQPAAPRFIVRKLVRFFVVDEPTLNDELIEPLAKQLREEEFHVGGVIRRILSSQLFFSELALARKIRSPIEVAVGLLRSLEGSTNVVELATDLRQLGHSLFYPPNVKGWDGGRTWINSSTLLGRANMVQRILSSPKTRFGGGNLSQLLATHNTESASDTVQWLADSLLATPLTPGVRERLVAIADENEEDRNEAIKQVIVAISTLPEFHLA